jgi:alpha/beta superfamily hydrolase
MRAAGRGRTRRSFLREALGLGLGSAVLGPSLSGCVSNCSPPIAWIPTMLAPVFYGYEELGPSQGAPVALRVFYPSLEGAPLDAPLLTCLGNYPLVAFLHGQCDEAEHYKRWFLLPAVLARCGFVVVVPELSWGGGQYPWDASSGQYDTALDVIDWMWTGWSGRDWLSGSSTLSLAGHSFGALLAGRLSLDIPNSALVSVGGGWAEWSVATPLPIYSLGVPSLFLFGTADEFAALPAPNWASVPTPTHRVIFDGGEHWDHLDPSQPTCGDTNGPCDLEAALTADLVAVFLSKILRVASVPDSLEPPALSLTAAQIFYAGNHLTSFGMLPRAGCGVTIEWNTSVAGAVTLPW